MVASSECKLRCQRRSLPKALLSNLQHQAMQNRAFPLKGTRCPSAVKHCQRCSCLEASVALQTPCASGCTPAAAVGQGVALTESININMPPTRMCHAATAVGGAPPSCRARRWDSPGCSRRRGRWAPPPAPPCSPLSPPPTAACPPAPRPWHRFEAATSGVQRHGLRWTRMHQTGTGLLCYCPSWPDHDPH